MKSPICLTSAPPPKLPLILSTTEFSSWLVYAVIFSKTLTFLLSDSLALAPEPKNSPEILSAIVKLLSISLTIRDILAENLFITSVRLRVNFLTLLLINSSLSARALLRFSLPIASSALAVTLLA